MSVESASCTTPRARASPALGDLATTSRPPRPILSALLDRLADRVVLFRYRGWVFVSFGLFGGVGALLTTGLTGLVLVGQGLDGVAFLGFALWGAVGVVVGSWLLGQLFDWRMLLRVPRAALSRPVFVSWGGVLGLALTLALFARGQGVSAWLLLDAVARSILLGHAIGRLGCLSYGCCYGRPTRGEPSITYRDPRAKAVRVGGLQGVPLHPAALYEAVADLALFVAVNGVALAGAPLGTPTALALLGYGCVRFAVEFLRDQTGRVAAGVLSLNHLIAVAMGGSGAWLIGRAATGSLGATPGIPWSALLAAVPWAAAASVPVSLVVFVGFSLHRGDVGRW